MAVFLAYHEYSVYALSRGVFLCFVNGRKQAVLDGQTVCRQLLRVLKELCSEGILEHTAKGRYRVLRPGI